MSSKTTKNSRWRRLMDVGLIEGFGQRVQAAFQYLDANDIGHFSLTDMTEKGVFVFKYLSIRTDNTTSYGFMDTFRKIDVDGSGQIDEDEFAIGIIELLRHFKSQTELIESIALDIMPAGTLSWEELMLVIDQSRESGTQKSSSSQSLSEHLSAMLDFLEKRVQIQMRADTTGIGMTDSEKLVEFIRDSIEEAIVDVRRHFHLPNKSKLDMIKTEKELEITTALKQYNMKSSAWELPKESRGDSIVIHNRLRRVSHNESEDKNVNQRIARLVPSQNEIIKYLQGMGLDPYDDAMTESLDVDKLRLLNTACKSLENFFSVVSGHSGDLEGLTSLLNEDHGGMRENNQGHLGSIRSFEKVLNALNKARIQTSASASSSIISTSHVEGVPPTTVVASTSGEGVSMIEFLELQETIRQKDLRLEILDIMQTHAVKMGASMIMQNNGDITHEFVDESDPSFYSIDSILAELIGLKGAIAERGILDSPEAQFLTDKFVLLPFEGKSGEENNNVTDVIESMSQNTIKIMQKMEEGGTSDQKDTKIDSYISRKEEEIARLQIFREEVEFERNNMIHTQVELQMLREKAQRLEDAETTTLSLKSKNLELQRKIAEKEQYIRDQEAVHKVTIAETSNESTLRLSSELKTKQREIRELTHQKNKVIRENQRLQLTSQQNEERYNVVLQENMNLRNEGLKFNDDLTASSIYLGEMKKTLEQERKLRGDRETLLTRNRELERIVALRESDIAEKTEETRHMAKLKRELEHLEDRNRELEDQIRTLNSERERAAASISQMEEYRKSLRDKEKDIRDLELQIYNLDSREKDHEIASVRYVAIEDEIKAYKEKIEKIPILVAEVSRLRGSNRAITKAMSDMDNQLTESRSNLTRVERENIRLKADLRRYVDSEQKMKDAQEHMGKHISNQLMSSVTASKNEEKDVEESEVEYKKVRRMLRQSIVDQVQGPRSPSP